MFYINNRAWFLVVFLRIEGVRELREARRKRFLALAPKHPGISLGEVHPLHCLLAIEPQGPIFRGICWLLVPLLHGRECSNACAQVIYRLLEPK